MEKSKIILYRTDLVFGKNYKIDNIEDYLITCKPSDTIEGRYCPCRLINTIVIKQAQKYIWATSYNYAKIINSDDSQTYYYHVIAMEWASKNSLKLTLRLDALNTFAKNYEEYIEGSKTQIIREHVDRWTKLSDGTYQAIVDPYDEGIDVAKEVGTVDVINKEIMYYCQISANATTPSIVDTHPFKTMICYGTKTLWSSGGSGSDTFLTGDAYGLIYTMLEGTIVNNEGTGHSIGTATISYNNQTGILRAVRFNGTTNSGSIRMQLIYCTGDKFPYSYLTTDTDTASKYVEISNCRRLYKENWDSSVWESLFNLDRIPFLDYLPINAGSYKAQYVNGINDIDRTNSSLLQINTIPYISLTGTNAKFIEGYNMLIPNTNTNNVVYGYSIKNNIKSISPSLYDIQNYNNESKLLHSSITESSINYQGSSLYNIDYTRATGYITISIEMQLSTDSTSNLKFTSIINNYDKLSPYDNVAVTVSKYVVPLYNNSWNDYVRNGYNYDVADRNRSKNMQVWNIAMGAVGVGLSIGSTIATGGLTAIGTASSIMDLSNRVNNYSKLSSSAINNANAITSNGSNFRKDGSLRTKASNQYNTYMQLASSYQEQYSSTQSQLDDLISKSNQGYSQLTGMVLHQGVGSLTSLGTAMSSIISANENYKKNINQKIQSKTVISGVTDDYSLAYDDNISYQVWKPRTYILENIAKVFHLTGYSHPVMEAPNENSRCWFNYVQAKLCWSIDAYEKFNGEILEEIARSYEEGITVFHENDNEYDISQLYENWETSLL